LKKKAVTKKKVNALGKSINSQRISKNVKSNLLAREIKRPSLSIYADREIGWLNFNRRVLAEAEDSRNPLLERVRFLGISNSNLDEFFMKRVGGIKRQIACGVSVLSKNSKPPEKHLAEIRKFVTPMLKEQAEIFVDQIQPALKKAGILLLKWKELKPSEKEYVHNFYRKNVFPVLTPLSVDPGHPFPFISNLSISLGVTLRSPNSQDTLFARIKIPKVLPQWIRIKTESEVYRYISLIDVIEEHLADLFPKMEVITSMAFRLTRNADSDGDAEDSEDLLEAIEEELRQRRFAEVIRLEHGLNPNEWMLELLMKELELSPDDVYQLPGLLDYTDLNIICDLSIPTLKFQSHSPVTFSKFNEENGNIFELIKSNDQLIHSPYESFSNSVERFIRIASEDENVLAIKMTLYRTGDNSPFIKSLIRAAENGKQVVCLIELKARFDEERNIYWASELESAGVHVVYGVVGLKTHAKTSLVVRQEEEGLKCYAHIGTGNYNISTSRHYTDLGLLTANEEITSDILEFFNFLTGKSLKSEYKKILVAPVNMFNQFCRLIAREAENAEDGLPSGIIAKFNNFEENKIGLELYNASQKGVNIDLVVRGFCCLSPGVANFSENIKIRSIIGRFLEHSRIFYFRNGCKDPIDGEFYIGSADWMYRNLHARVEAIVPILSRQLKEKCWRILQLCIEDERQSWIMNKDGIYFRKVSRKSGIQELLIKDTEKQFYESEFSEASF